MQFTTTAAALRDAVGVARHATSANPANLAHGGVMLHVKGARLSVIGSDGDTTIAVACSVTAATDGAVLIPPKPITDFLATLPAACEVTVTCDSGDVTVNVAHLTPYRFRPIDATFPLPATPRDRAVKVDFSRLGDAVTALKPAVHRDHNGIQLHSDSTGLSLRATDNYRIHAAHLPEAGFGDFTGVVPVTVLQHLARHPVDNVTTDPDGRLLRFAGRSLLVSARLLAVPFPDCSPFLTATAPVTCTLDTEAVLDALGRLGAIAGTVPITVTADGAELTLEVANPDVGDGTEIVELAAPATDLIRFAVDRSYLTAALAAHSAPSATLGYTGELTPVVVRSTDPFATTTIVMPVRP